MTQWQNGEDRSEWESTFASFEQANFLQSWQWGEVQADLKNVVVRRILIQDGSATGLMSMTVKNARRGRYLEVPGGPLIDWNDSEAVVSARTELIAVARQHSCAFVRFRPQLLDTSDNQKLLQPFDARPAKMHLAADYTSVIDITPDTEQLLANMRQQTRYEVRRADKRGLHVSWSSELSAADELHELQRETARRQGFVPPTKQFLNACMSGLGDQARVYRAEKDGATLNLALVIFSGHEAAYYEAASSPDARKEPGAYAIIWQSILDAKSMGMTRYNMWGTAPPDSIEHRFLGLTTFKRGFGGEDVAYIHAHDLVVSRPRYAFNWIIETIRKKRRKL